MSDPLPVIVIDIEAPQPTRMVAVLLWMISSWAVLVIAGMIALSTPDALGAAHPVSFTRAAFTSMNAATASGFSQQFAKVEDFSPFVRGVLGAETIGGILLSLIGGGVVLNCVLRACVRESRVVIGSIALLAIAAAAGVATKSGETSGHAIFRGICALGGAGPAQQLQGWSGLGVKLVLTPLALLGSFGALAITMLLRRGPSSPPFREHFRRVMTVAAVAYLVGFALNDAQFLAAGMPGRSAIEASSAIALAARGWGTAVDFASAWPRGVAWSAVAISIVGVGTLGAMPGIGLAWLVTFPRTLWAAVLTLLSIQAAAGLAVLLILLNTEPQLSAERIVMLVVSAAAKTGLSHEAVSITGVGLLALSALMAISKILPLGLLFVIDRRHTQ